MGFAYLARANIIACGFICGILIARVPSAHSELSAGAPGLNPDLDTTGGNQVRRHSVSLAQAGDGDSGGPAVSWQASGPPEKLAESLARLEGNLASLLQSFLGLQRSVFNVEQLQELLVLLLEDILKQTGNVNQVPQKEHALPKTGSTNQITGDSNEDDSNDVVLSADIDQTGNDVGTNRGGGGGGGGGGGVTETNERAVREDSLQTARTVDGDDSDSALARAKNPNALFESQGFLPPTEDAGADEGGSSHRSDSHGENENMFRQAGQLATDDPRGQRSVWSEPLTVTSTQNIRQRIQDVVGQLTARLEMSEHTNFPSRRLGMLQAAPKSRWRLGESTLEQRLAFAPLEVDQNQGKLRPRIFPFHVKRHSVFPVISHGGPRVGPGHKSSPFLEQFAALAHRETSGERATGMIDNLVQSTDIHNVPFTNVSDATHTLHQSPRSISILRKKRQTSSSLKSLLVGMTANATDTMAMTAVVQENKEPRDPLPTVPKAKALVLANDSTPAPTEVPLPENHAYSNGYLSLTPANETANFSVATQETNLTHHGPQDIAAEGEYDALIADLMKDLSNKLNQYHVQQPNVQDNSSDGVIDRVVSELNKLIWIPSDEDAALQTLMTDLQVASTTMASATFGSGAGNTSTDWNNGPMAGNVTVMDAGTSPLMNETEQKQRDYNAASAQNHAMKPDGSLADNESARLRYADTEQFQRGLGMHDLSRTFPVKSQVGKDATISTSDSRTFIQGGKDATTSTSDSRTFSQVGKDATASMSNPRTFSQVGKDATAGISETRTFSQVGKDATTSTSDTRTFSHVGTSDTRTFSQVGKDASTSMPETGTSSPAGKEATTSSPDANLIRWDWIQHVPRETPTNPEWSWLIDTLTQLSQLEHLAEDMRILSDRGQSLVKGKPTTADGDSDWLTDENENADESSVKTATPANTISDHYDQEHPDLSGNSREDSVGSEAATANTNHATLKRKVPNKITDGNSEGYREVNLQSSNDNGEVGRLDSDKTSAESATDDDGDDDNSSKKKRLVKQDNESNQIRRRRRHTQKFVHAGMQSNVQSTPQEVHSQFLTHQTLPETTYEHQQLNTISLRSDLNHPKNAMLSNRETVSHANLKVHHSKSPYGTPPQQQQQNHVQYVSLFPHGHTSSHRRFHHTSLSGYPNYLNHLGFPSWAFPSLRGLEPEETQAMEQRSPVDLEDVLDNLFQRYWQKANSLYPSLATPFTEEDLDDETEISEIEKLAGTENPSPASSTPPTSAADSTPAAVVTGQHENLSTLEVASSSTEAPSPSNSSVSSFPTLPPSQPTP